MPAGGSLCLENHMFQLSETTPSLHSIILGSPCSGINGFAYIVSFGEEECPIPMPSDGEVQIHVRSVGVCGSDASLFRTAQVGFFPLKEPLVLGHEPCGVVSLLGPGVTDLHIGDRVAVAPHKFCSTCSACLEGRYNLCPHAEMMATPPTDGALANCIVWPASLCFKMPAEMTWEEGAFVQPMALAVYGCQRAGVKPGHHVLICGAGPLGTVMVVAAKAYGATRICVTDISEERLQFLSEMCGCSTFLAEKGTPSEIADRVTTLLGGVIDVTIECSGAPSAVTTGIYATKPGGCLLLAGIGPAEVQIPLLAAALKELDIKSMMRFVNTYPAAIELMVSGRIDVKPLVTQQFKLSDVNQAFEAMNNKVQGKVVIKCSED